MAVFDEMAKEYGFWEWTVSPHRYQEALDYLQPGAQRAIDVGCGAGPLALRLGERVPHVVGVDPSAELISIGRARQAQQRKHNVEFMVGSLEALPFAPGSFDFVTCYRVLHFVPPVAGLQALRALLKPGGRLVVCNVYHPHAGRLGLADQAYRVLKMAPGQVRLYGLAAAWRIMRFQTSAQWLRQLRSYRFLPPDEFRSISSQVLPGCRFERFRWETAAFWQAPG